MSAESRNSAIRSETNSREFAVEVVKRLRECGHTALFAGGCVRDFLMGRPSKDFDVATTALPDQVRKIFGHKRTLAIGASFGVIVVLGPRGTTQVEVATFRTEGDYRDGRRPERVEFCTPEDDARRRDFTINGMFFDPIQDEVLDFVDGRADLAARIVRAIGVPSERMQEDKLRMLRAVRFAAAFDFALDDATADAIRQMSSELIVVSAERIAQELRKMLVDKNRRRSVELATDVQLFRMIFPELDSIQHYSDWDFVLRRLELLDNPSFELALATLLSPLPIRPDVEAICRRLKLSNQETEHSVWLLSHRADLDDAPKLSLAALKRRLAHPLVSDLLKFMQAERSAMALTQEPVQFSHDYLANNSMDVINPVPLVTGDDLVTIGMRPGPNFKRILDDIRDAQLDLKISTREEGLAMARMADTTN